MKYVVLLLIILLRSVCCQQTIITTIAGTGSTAYSGDNGAATSATLANPIGVALDTSGNVYIADISNNRIRKVSTGIITTIAGTGSTIYSGDNGAATSATLYYPSGVAVDASGNVYIADASNHRIRKVTVSTGIITTIAGSSTSGSYSGDNGAATSATLNLPRGVALDASGNVYIADTSNSRIRKVSTGIITTIAGTGTSSYSGDGGAATSATLYYPYGVAVDASGNVYIADESNNRIRKVTESTGIISTIAGTGSGGYSGDNGAATSATLYNPRGVALDASGNVYIADLINNRIRKVTVSTGIITTIAGSSTSTSYSGDGGVATSATLYYPSGVAVDASGNVYIADRYNNRIRKVTIEGASYGPTESPTGLTIIPSMTPSTLQPSLTPTTYPSSTPTIAPTKIPTMQPTRQPSATPTVIPSTVAPSESPSYNPTLTPSNFPTVIPTLVPTAIPSVQPTPAAPTHIPTIVPTSQPPTKVPSCVPSMFPTVVPSSMPSQLSSVIPTDTPSIMPTMTPATTPSMDPTTIQSSLAPTSYPSRSPNTVFIITTIAGYGASGYSGDNGAATSAALSGPFGVALDSVGNVYIADTGNCRIRKVTVSTGIITTIAGTGTASFSGDGGPATSATLHFPEGIGLDSVGNVYIAEQWSNRIRKVTVSTSYITTIAGTGAANYSGDGGVATSAALNYPTGVAADMEGNIYIVDYGNHRIRKVTVSTDIISTIAGTGVASYDGDDVAATMAALNYPTGIALDSSGNVYIADRTNLRIRKVTVATGYISTIAGNGSGYSGDNGAATSAGLAYPYAVALDSAGNLYISDSSAQRIRVVTASSGIISTIAGTGAVGYSGDGGAATAAVMNLPEGIVVDSSGNIYFTDYYNCAIRKVTVSVPTTMPSVVPTLSPSAYPTYTSSVRVYFMVTHALSGVSASVYSSNKDNNDAAFKQTVVSMMGYDSRVDDVNIHLVTDVVSRRSQAETVAEIEFLYSITSPTRIFNDTNRATARFIQSLNESIAMGAFDTLLHANIGTTDWQSVSTEYVIFSTASPSSSPTSTPTFAPTKRDNVAANLFDIPLDEKMAKAKIQYFLGAFVGYFLSIYVCLYLYSFLRHGKDTATKLYDASYQSGAHINNSAATDNHCNILILRDLYTKNLLVQSNIKLEAELMVMKQNSTTKHDDEADAERKYSKAYREYIHQQRTLLGCSPFLYPDGCVIKIPCTSIEVHLPPGRVENMLLFICHNHPLFSCFYFMDGSKLGAHGTRILYIGKDIVVFVLYQFSNMLLQYLTLDGYGLGMFINLFIITPTAVSVGLLLKYLYTCPFTETVEFQRKYAKYETLVLMLGQLAILPIMLTMMGSLIIACLFSSGRRIPTIIVNYFLSVQFYGSLLAIAKTMLLFVDGYFYQLSLFGMIDVLYIGRLYKERIIVEQLVLDVDYACRTSTYLFGLVKVQKILNRDDAIKAKWIAVVEGDIEMKGGHSGGTGDDEACHNPLASRVTGHRGSGQLTMDAIYGTSNNNNEVGSVCKVGAGGGSSAMAVENPIHLFVNATKHQDLLRLQHSVINSSEEVALAVDDDAALYLEYQSLQDSHNDALYDMADDSGVAMTFEDWKATRRQFKQGTRGSFVKAFQVFEEREQSARDKLDQSASLKNTMHLHSVKAKNVLASRSGIK